ncbi:MAG: EamA family transporter [Rhodospirillales bacterium]|nr:EamA family transporter [Rhodospirillales bacterium]
MKPVDILLAICVPVLWGLGFTLAKVAFVYVSFPPILLMAFRFMVTALVLVWFVRPPWGLMHRIFWIAVISATIQYSLMFTGLDGIDASLAVIVVQLEAPFLALFAAIFLKEHLGWRRAIGMFFAFTGVMLIAGQPRMQGDLLPVLLVASGACVWAGGQIMIKGLGGKVGGFTLIAWVAVFATPQLFLSSWLFEEGQWQAIQNAGWIGWGVVIYMGLIMTALGYAIWYRLLGLYNVNQVMPFLLLLPVMSIAGSMLFLGERLSMLEVFGSAVVILGVSIITTHRERTVEQKS